MGAWGTEPWGNDGAADWFGDLWDGFPLAERVHAGLTADSSDEMVAALWLCSELCRVYVWPIDTLDETLRLAVAAADQILAEADPDRYLDRWDGDPVVRGQIEALRAALAARQN